MLRSLRVRLTAGLTFVLAVVLFVFGALIYRDVDRDERAALDDRLQRTAELSRATALAAVQDELPDADARLDAVLDATRSSLRLVLGDAVLLETGDPPPRRPPLRSALQTFTVDGVAYRALKTELRDPNLGGLAVLEVTTRLSALENRLERQRRTLYGLGALALLLAAGGVFLAAGFALRPLARLREATTSIAEDEDLSRRVATDGGAAELRAVATSFNAMLARLDRSAADRERALQATRRFAADAGHELRTPMTSLQTTLTSLARHPELDAERRTRMATDALASQQRLGALVDGLQALARGDAAPAHASVDLAELVDQAVAGAASRHPGVRFAPALPEDELLRDGWEPGLRSLVDNLLENAARHGRPGGTVRVSLDAQALVVEDDGPGIPDAERRRVFEPFVRGERTVADGSGLGLALVAQQAVHHGYGVVVDASPQLGGARVRVAFEPPSSDAEAPATA